MINLKNDTAQIDDLLARMAEAIQLDDTRKERMESAYGAIEEVLNTDEGFFKHIDFEIYPQGSVRIGTTVKPLASKEFDLDIVVHIKVDWKKYTPQYIYNQLKRVLINNGNYKDKVELKNRCIRLNYAGDFHMDILPGCQELDWDENKLLVPDRELGDWTSSNPRGYGDWFIGKANSVQITLLEKAYAMEELPPDDFAKKKPLQRAVQLLKLYRDKYFETNPEMATSSIILTTIAGQFYNGEDSIYNTIDGIIGSIKTRLSSTSYYGKRIVILNPVNDKEDFTDKWADDKEPALYRHFEKFIKHLDIEWSKLKRNMGVVEESKVLKGLFGEAAFAKAQKAQVDFIEKARQNRTLGMSNRTGILSGITSLDTQKRVESNIFFGGEH